uniref:Uncharacterized protein n=1 Tax=viral metagenome TaxID=1070528 RepID=A0A6H1ZYV1_9ZZZZ
MGADLIYRYCICGCRFELVEVLTETGPKWAFSNTVVNQFSKVCLWCGKVNKPYELSTYIGQFRKGNMKE